MGDRIPGIWFHKTKGVLVSTGLDGKASFNKFVKPLPSVGAWTRIEVKQSLVSSQHIFSITIGNEEVFTKPNTKPVELSDVKVFAGNPWSSSQKGSLRNLKIEIKKTSIDCVPAGGMHLKYFSKWVDSLKNSWLRTKIRSAIFPLLRCWGFKLPSRLGDNILSPKWTPAEEEQPSDNPPHPQQGVESLLRIQGNKLQTKIECADLAVDNWQQKWEHWRPNSCPVDP